jgi:hypothetical protein
MVNSKNAFWQALVFTLIIFVLGLTLGFFFEVTRASYARDIVSNSEISLLDEQLRDRAVTDLNISCSTAIPNLFRFADQIYGEAQQLESKEASTHFSSELAPVHRRYDLLRTMLWLEGVTLKDRCGNSFHTLVYLYTYKTDNVELNAEQIFFSHLLLDLKYKHPKEILLIPIATNTQLESVNLVLKEYAVSQTPMIIIDENITLTEIVTLEDLESIVFQRNN